ncbi:16S rRNA (uracil(1498)-N(3))-methyltransferase [Motilimonas cestriensis]|uniref:Ribosomal RNA small subunit methyltransferase E n=1 Tax=Motilimonas cestriensis TaxID=2742685 RepID=A0ABS8WA23_9GAMM|nr:16S rRNA (uracil(1498)-N(3))-methyltransferase [Motilimonas cestriensis]MCE2595876.1 16S rRNA (uracil(1498)-N(3))-methyltransferase [Motilimonas cestriensis]
MRVPRIYEPQALRLNTQLDLNDDAANHVGRVLRLNVGDQIWLFNGEDENQYLANIVQSTKKHVQVKIVECQTTANESPLKIHLGQAISRGDRMDFVIQKSVELGVDAITPIFSERCGVKLSGERLEKKRQQWQKIAIAACEQSGRNQVPEINQPISFNDWINQQDDAVKLTLHPRANYRINTLPEPKVKQIRLLIGPEGGFTGDEVNLSEQAGFIETLLGPRILRTETAALTAITALQCRFGDLG